MEATEIPNEARSLGICRGCRPNKHYCSWVVDGEYYCEDCYKKKAGIVDEPEESLVIADSPVVALGQMYNPGPDFPFTLNPTKTTNLSVGQLATGWVLNVDGESSMFASKAKLMAELTRVIGGKK